MDSLRERALRGRQLVLLGVLANVILASFKIVTGVVGKSHALIADGIESAMDLFSSAVMWGAIKYAEKPPDEDHPYGHGRMESFAATVGSLFVILAGLAVAFTSIREILSGAENPQVPATFTLLVLAITIIIKEGLFRLLVSEGKKIGSRAVETDAWHHRSDALTSLAAGIGITIAIVGGPKWATADDWAALFSCSFIIFNGARMLKESSSDMLDEQADPETVETVRKIACEVHGVTSVEKCRVRRSGLARIADLHVRVPGAMTVHEGHEIAHRVKDRLAASELRISDTTVHIEPEDEANASIS